MTHVDERSDSTPAEPERPDSDPPEHPDRTREQRGSSAIRLALLVGSIVLLGLWAGVSALVVVLAIVVMIFLHELGHFVTAKAAGMKCTEFFIGIGPRIWSFTRGETEYGVKAIPAVAYVKVIGMTNLEEVDEADEDRTYRQKPYWRRMSVAVAGSAMHFLLALICLLVVFVAVGVPEDDTWEVGRLVGSVEGEASPAGQAGVEVGDRIVAVDGSEVVVWDDLVDALAGPGPGEVVTVTVERDGTLHDLPVTLGVHPERDGAGFLGMGPHYPPQSMSPLTAVGRTGSEFATYSQLTVEAIVRLFSPEGLSNFFGLAFDTASAPEPTSTADDTELEGQEDRVLSIYGAARLGTQMADTGPAGLLLFFALINIFIGIFNLVPLLPLDGGYVAIGTYERARELLSRSKNRYHADVARLIPLTYAVIVLLAGIGLVALYLDIANPLNLPT